MGEADRRVVRDRHPAFDRRPPSHGIARWHPHCWKEAATRQPPPPTTLPLPTPSRVVAAAAIEHRGRGITKSRRKLRTRCADARRFAHPPSSSTTPPPLRADSRASDMKESIREVKKNVARGRC